MKVNEIKTSENNTFYEIECTSISEKEIIYTTGEIKSGPGEYFDYITNGSVYTFKIDEVQKANLVREHFKQNKSNLVEIKRVQNDKRKFLLNITFFHSFSFEGEWNVVLSEKVLEKLKTSKIYSEIVLSNAEYLEKSIIKNFEIVLSDKSYFVYTMGKNKINYDDIFNNKNNNFENQFSQDLNEIEEVDEKNTDEILLNLIDGQEKLKSIKLYGVDYDLKIKFVSDKGEEYLLAENIDIRYRKSPSMTLAQGKLTFKDSERVVSESVKKELALMSGYLDLWEQYTKLEGDFLLKKARNIGAFKINKASATINNNCFAVHVLGLNEDSRKLLQNGDFLMFTEDVPIYIADESMTWNKYKDYISNLNAMKLPNQKTVLRKLEKIDDNNFFHIKFSNDNIGTIDEIPDGFVSMSIYGDISQINRREEARNLILNGESANPTLGLTIEGKMIKGIYNKSNLKKINPLSSFVKEKIFKNEPTSTQLSAIDIALNTPDIAIIQGPPGTGKTTVITAIIERLNEVLDKSGDNRGQVLITSFQHDAVKNVIERLSVNSLPTIKFGSRSDDDSSSDRMVEDWCNSYIKQIKDKNPSIQSTLEQKELAKLHDFYIVSPNDTNALALLNYAEKITYDNDFIQEIKYIKEDIRLKTETESYDNQNLLNMIRRLRVTESGFQDDGAVAAYNLYCELEKIMAPQIEENKKILNILDEASVSVKLTEKLTEDLIFAKDLLLKKCTPRTVFQLEVPRDDIKELYLKLQPSLQKPHNEFDNILANLLNQLENNTEVVKDAIAGYNFVYAATTQQSEGKEIKQAKGIMKNEHPVYNTVIIDEAARVNPGDLMIPMSQASRRIILVGDHRQLPHIYNEEIFGSVQQKDDSIDISNVKTSMFQYLMSKAKELQDAEANAGEIVNQRIITLDAQYRMHPLLGEFVSKNFYEVHGESFKSPRPASDFIQNICPKPLAWVEIPHEKGNEDKSGTSRIRVAEADYIVESIEKNIQSDMGKDLSYGVISFYSAQVSLIKRKLKEKLGALSELVRVGSVDAFQGMEFDVIYLSVVRTHKGAPNADIELLSRDISNFSEDDEEYKEWFKYKENVGLSNYGFITSENRLCVAVSRQKKLLIVVGNSSIFREKSWGIVAEKCVPQMKRLYELCEKEGEIKNG